MKRSKRICTLAFTGIFMLAALTACGQADQNVKFVILKENLKTPQAEAPAMDKADVIVDMLNTMGRVDACTTNGTNTTAKAVFENTLKEEAQELLHDIASGEPEYAEDSKLASVRLEIAAAEKLKQHIENINEPKVRVRNGITKKSFELEEEDEKPFYLSLESFMLNQENPVETIYELYNWLASEEEPTIYTIGLAHETIGGTDCYLLLTGKKEPQKQGEVTDRPGQGEAEGNLEEMLPEDETAQEEPLE